MFRQWFWYWYRYILNNLCTDQTWTEWVWDCRWLCNYYCAWYSGYPKDNNGYDYVSNYRYRWITVQNSWGPDGYYCEFGGIGVAPTFYDRGYVRVRPSCQFNIDSKNCGYQRQCWWNPFTNKCVDNKCYGYPTVAQCRADPTCGWDIDSLYPNTCDVQTCYGGFTNVDSCNVVSDCFWTSFNGVMGCHDRMCSLFTSPCACAVQTQCFWDVNFNGDGAGMGSCVEDTYALCPGVDMAIMTQTPVYSDGRDFWSATEALRRWLPTMPLTTSTWTDDSKSHGVRIANYLWGRNTYVAYYNRGNGGIISYNPNSFPTGQMALTGSVTELIAQIVWFERVYTQVWYRSWTMFCLPAITMGRRMLSFTAANRQKIALMMTNVNKFYDTATTLTLHKSWYQTTCTFLLGYMNLQSITIEFQWGAMSPLYTLSNDPNNAIRYFTNGVAIEGGLDGMCETGKSGWNTAVVKSTTRAGMCESLLTEDACGADDGCIYIDTKCIQSECIAICTEPLCDSDTRCIWKVGGCRGITCHLFANQATCDQHFDSCRWDNETHSPAQCIMRNCVAHDNEDDCLQDPAACLWDTDVNPNGNCRENKCNVDSHAACNALSPCLWDIKVSPEACRENQCTPFNNLTKASMMQSCNTRDTCHLKDQSNNVTLCEERWCSGYAQESDCWTDRLCKWDNLIAPSACVDTYCGKYENGDDCAAGDRECEWDPTHENEEHRANGVPDQGVCLDKRCSYDTTGCRCMGHDGCFWNMGQCRNWPLYNMTNVDLHILVDGSQALGTYYSGHEVGFVGVMEQLRYFVENIPLTNQIMGNTSTSADVGFRVMVYQYGSRSGVVTSPLLTALSGDRTELLSGIAWHANNFQKYGGTPAICPSIKNIASAIDTDMKNNNNDRNKIIVGLVAGGTSDAKYCSTPLQTLDDMNVQVFGVGLISTEETVLNTATNSTVMNLGSDPIAVHSWAMTVEQFVPEVLFFTDDWAVDSTFIPNQINTMVNMDTYGSCQTYPDNQLMCMRNPFCEWKSSQVCLHAQGCSNLGCKTVVDARPYASFTCGNCQLLNGQVDCQYNFNFPYTAFETDCNNARCTTLCDHQDCDDDPACMWNATQGICQRMVCLFTDEGICVSDFTCAWEIDRNPNTCRLNKCTGFDNYNDCMGAINITQTVCLWNAGASNVPMCTENPCAVETFNDCENRPNQLCKWDFDMDPPQCRQKFCQYDAEVDCTDDQDHNCEWLSDSMTCREKPCQWNKAGCDLDSRCSTLISYATANQTFACREANCDYKDGDSCSFDRKCKWLGTTCAERWCTGLADQVTCAKSNLCEWDVTESPSVCMPNNCSRYAESEVECTALECQWELPTEFPTWTPYHGGCVFKPCSYYTNACNCSVDSRCFFETGTLTAPVDKCIYSSQAGCQPLDLLLIFGVAGDIYRPVGRRPNGYTAMWEMIRTWSETAGLTGQSYVDLPDSMVGIRLALVEFTGSNTTATVSSTTGAHGRFTGDLKELSADIDYHIDNFVSPSNDYQPMFAPSLLAAKSIFETYSTNPDRERAVLFFVDGLPNDHDATQNAAEDLKDANITLFTIQIDTTIDAQISTKEYDIQQFMQDLASDPKDLHYVGTYLDNIPSVVLNGVCNPNAMVGRYLGRDDKMCPQIDNSVECNQRAECNWDDSAVLACPNQGGCPNLNCIALLNSQLRDGYGCSDCAFANGTVSCGGGIFNPVVSGACIAHPCMHNCNQASCEASPLECLYNSTFSTCFDKTCETKYFTQGPCDDDVRCNWDPALDRCRDDLCTLYTDSVSCNNQTDVCLWSAASSPAVCLEQKCTYIHAGTCDKDNRCLWYNDTCIIRPCLHATETACKNDATYKCEWDTSSSPAFCRENNCTNIPDQTSCTSSSYCAWDDTEYYDECSGFTMTMCDLYNAECEFIGANCRSMKSCREDLCKRFTSSTTCGAQTVCLWSGGKCIENECAILNSERRCAAADKCGWVDSSSPGYCDFLPCAELAAGTCSTNANCKDNNIVVPACTPKTCLDFSSKCHCEELQNCFWDVATAPAACVDGRFTACRTNMDIVFLLDGSDSMLEPMGRHTAPLIGITEFIRQWVRAAPLTNTPAGSTTPGNGMRIGIVRAGDTNMCGDGTNCQLTGESAQLEDDLNFIAANILAQPQMIIDGAYTKILSMFSPDKSRTRVVVIVAGSPAGYVDYDMTNLLMLNNISVVGAALQSDSDTTVSLQLLVNSPPSQYVDGVNIDDFDDHFLSRLCDAFDFFTPLLSSAAAVAVEHITLPCPGLPQLLCDSYPHCAYNANEVASCTADGCIQLQCQDIPEELVEAGMICSNCKLVNSAIKCNPYFVNTADMGVCEKTICTQFCDNQTGCEAAGCIYTTATGDCRKSLCESTTKDGCLQSPACVWDDYGFPSKCRVTLCPVQTQTGCTVQDKCRWSVYAAGTISDPQCKEVACPYEFPLDCTRNPDCIWNATTHTCSIRTCMYGDYEPCISDKTCEWPWWNPVCMPRVCLDSYDQATCLAIPQCEYVGIHCKRIACNYTTAELCANPQNENCYWNNGKCYESCSTRYETQALCNNPTVAIDATRCRWDTLLARCTRRCDDIGSNGTACDIAAACEFSWNATVPTCEQRCENTYFNATPCNSNPKCMWDSWVVPYQCKRACPANLIYNASHCDQDAACYVKDLIPFTCDTVCSLRPNHDNLTICVNDTDCEWDYGADYCTEKLCRFADQTICEQDIRCRFDTGVCTRKCGFHAIQPLCHDDLLCMWLPSVNECVDDCRTNGNEDLCVNNTRCNWDSAGYCYTMCEYAFNVRSECESDKQCSWNWDSDTCEHRPCDFDSQIACNDDTTGSCEWTNSDKRAVDVAFEGLNNATYFNLGAYAGCTASNYFQLIPKAAGLVAVQFVIFPCNTLTRCPTYESIRASVQNNDASCGCKYTHSMASNQLLWPSFPVNTNPTTNGAGWLATSGMTLYVKDTTNRNLAGHIVLQMECPGECRQVCAAHQTQSNCENFQYTGGDCMWDIDNNLCHTKCSLFTDVVDCANRTWCQWHPTHTANQCQLKCSLRQYTTKTTCESDPLCWWTPFKSSCMSKCTEFDNAEDCGAQDGQCNFFGDGICRVSCNLLGPTRLSCRTSASAYCMWNDDNNQCEGSCSVRFSLDQTGLDLCTSNSRCEVVAGACVTQCPYRLWDEITCGTDNRCMWDVDHTVCNTNCAYRTNGDWCEWTSMCHWVESSIAGNYTGYCRSECQYLPDMNSTSCAAKYTREDTCTWDTIRSHCYATCPDLTNSSRCESNVVCKWVGTVCMNDCSQYSTANCLNHGDNCSIEADFNGVDQCVTDCATYGSDSSRCLSNSRCEYMYADNICVKGCRSKYSNQTQCNEDPRCLWDRLNAVCVNDCPNRLNVSSCRADPTVCYVSLTSNGTDETCVFLAQRGPTSVTGTSKQYLDDRTMSGTSYTTSVTVSPTAAGDGSITFPLNKKYNTFRADVGVDSVCSTCQGFEDGFDIEHWLDNTMIFAIRNLTCSFPAVSVNIDISNRTTLRLVVKSVGTSVCDLAMWGNPTICTSIVSDSTCKRQCQYKYSSEGACNQDSDCMWDGDQAVCRMTCSFKTNEEQCSGDPMCIYDSYLPTPCRRSCTSLTQESCLADDYCNYDLGLCYKTCQNRHGLDECNEELSRCEWNGLQSGQEAIYGSDCYRACSLRGSYSECMADPNQRCKWNNKSSTCRMKCELDYYGQPTCESDSQCEYAAGTQLCEMRCMYMHDNSIDCNLESRCMWNPVKSLCDKACSEYVSSAECLQSAICVPRGGDCMAKCPYRYALQKPCDQDDECMWDASTYTCKVMCDMANTADDCRSNYKCEWDNSFAGHCPADGNRTMCAPLGTSQAECLSFDGCCFDTAGCQYEADCAVPWCFVSTPRCKFDCEDRYLNIDDCNNSPDCRWSAEGKCHKACDKITDVNACTSTDSCEYDVPSSQCLPTCRAKYLIAADCNADTSCMWFNASGVCSPPCDGMSQVECFSHPSACMWDNNACRKTCAQMYQTVPACEADSRCLWDTYVGGCGPMCDFIVAQTDCSTQPRCGWRSWDSTCKLLCSAYTSLADCTTKDDSCEWANGIDPNTMEPLYPIVWRCDRPCPLRYSQQAVCDNDIDCMWDVTVGTCVAFCARIAAGSKTAAAFGDACRAVSVMCEVDSIHNQCDVKCGYRYSEVNSCNQDSECIWNNDLQKCQRQCALMTNNQQCTDAPMCEWELDTTLCTYRCPYRYTTNTTCVPDVQCDWNYDSNRCESTCNRFMNAGDCSSVSSCWWHYGNLECFKRCDLAFEGQASCDNDPNCQWDTVNGICRRNCDLLLTENQCDQWPDICVFILPIASGEIRYSNTTPNTCAATCKLRYGDQPSCDGDTLCMWDVDVGSCRPHCSQVAATNDCIADRLCQWRPSSSSCAKECAIVTNATECAGLLFCDYSPNYLTCKKVCGERYTSVDTCSDLDCMWDDGSSNCVKACERIDTNNACSALSECVWDASSSVVCAALVPDRVSCGNSTVVLSQTDCAALGCCFEVTSGATCYAPEPKCQRSCTMKYLTLLDCNADSICQWDSVRSQCSRKCSVITGTTSCVAASMCQWKNATCVNQCIYQYTNPTDCEADPACNWDAAVATCRNDCTRHNAGTSAENQADCATDSTCVWANNECEPNCETAYGDWGTCESNNRCMWDMNNGQCRTRCGLQGSPSQCAATGGSMCEWNTLTTNCDKKCEFRANTSTACGTDVTCYWDTTDSTGVGVCRKVCGLIGDTQTCHDRVSCSWDVSATKCMLACEVRAQSDCAVWNQCEYNPSLSQCNRMCGYKYADQPTCDADGLCM